MTPMEYRPGRGVQFWRAFVIVLALAVALLSFAVVGLFNSNHDSIERGKEAIAKNRELGCRIGAFLVGIPIVKQPGTSQKTFEHSVVAAEDFLHALKALDCKGLGKVTTSAINKQLHALHKIVPEGGGRSTGNPHQPGSPAGGGPTAAPPSPSPPPTVPPSPTTTPPPLPPPSPPPPSTTTTPRPPPEPPPILRRVCRVDPILGRVCRLVPAFQILGLFPT